MLGTRVFRVFVSSTFRDLRMERDALQERVFPELRAYCAERGYGFQAVDLRWGIGEEAAAGHRTVRICLSEVVRCQEVSPRPNFIVLLGDRYGWRPLPETIPADEFEAVRAQLPADDQVRVDAAYERDDNAVPAEYVLATAVGEATSAEESLRRVLADAARRAGLRDEALAKYRLSATEQEVLKGAFEAEHAEEHVFGFVREIDGLPDHVPPLGEGAGTWPPAAQYRDYTAEGEPDAETARMLGALKRRLRARLAGNVFEYRASWSGTAPGSAHLDALCDDVLRSLSRVIDAEIERLAAYSLFERERAAHGEFGREHARDFVGRASVRAAIAGYVAGGTPHPLVVSACGGLGKSALMARAALDVGNALPRALVVTRFIGVTSASADARSLLEDLCAEIGEAYGTRESPPSTLDDLRQAFRERLKLASASRPLVVLLDGLDQLAGNSANLTWLPTELPPGVRLVVATRPGPALDALLNRVPADSVLEVGGMPVEEGEVLLERWLAAAHRALQPGQRDGVLRAFGACGSPLFLRLAFEEASQWRSARVGAGLAADVSSVIGGLFDRLEAEHGTQLVAHTLGFLACAYERQGLSEDELLDALARDEETWAEFVAGAAWGVGARRLPVVVWSRLYFDLERYVSPRASEGTPLVTFFHAELAEVARRRYVEPSAPHIHGVVADVMSDLARGRDVEGRAWAGSTHPLAELPTYLTRAERWRELFVLLTDFTFLEETARRVAVVTPAARAGEPGVYAGVLALVGDVGRALEALPVDAVEQREALEALHRTLNQESHTLRRRPDLLWQQVYNRLQFSHARAGLLGEVLDRERATRERSGAPWLHALTPPRESTALLCTLAGHTLPVWAVAYSPDGAKIASGSLDRSLRIWDAKTGAELAVLGPPGLVTSVDCSPDGRHLVSGDAFGGLRLWDADSATEVFALAAHDGWVTSCAFASDGRHVVSAGDDGRVRMWDVEARVCRTDIRVTGPLAAVQRRAMRALLSFIGSKSLSGRDAAKFGLLTEGVAKERGVDFVLMGLGLVCALSPDGSRIASLGWASGLAIWDTATGRQVRFLGGRRKVTPALAYSPDGTRVVFGLTDNTLVIRDVATGTTLGVLSGHKAPARALAWAPDGRHIAVSGGLDATVRLFDAAEHTERAALPGHAGQVTAVAFNPRSTRLVSASTDCTLKVWDATVGKTVVSLGGHTAAVSAVAYAPDSSRIVSASSVDGSVIVWDADAQTPRVRLDGHRLGVSDRLGVNAVCFSPDGRRIASGSSQDPVTVKNLKIWDAETGAELFGSAAHDSSIRAVAFAPDGKQIATGADDAMVTLWDASTGTVLATLRGHAGAVEALSYSPDGRRLVTGSADKTLKVWDAFTGVDLGTLIGHGRGVNSVAYAPDGRRIASSAGDRTLAIWDPGTCALIASREVGSDSVVGVAYSSDGRLVATSSESGALRLLDAFSLECLMTALWSVPLGGCAAAPNGGRVCCGDQSGAVHVLELVGIGARGVTA